MSALTDLSDSLQALAVDVGPRIVAVEGADGRQFSGFVWRTGLAVTADEALEGEDEVEVLKPDGSVVKARIAGRDPSTDVALLSFDTGEFGDWPATEARVGALALVAGRGEESPIARLAMVSAVGPAWRSMRGGQIDKRVTLDLRPGRRSEGGAIVSPDGKLIGMGVTGARGQALVIPASTIARAVATLSEKGYVPRGWLGVMLHPVRQGEGAIVLSVEAGSPAAKAGLLVGDVITTWGGEAVTAVSNISDRLGAGSVGQSVKLGVSRGGHVSDYDVAIAERPRG